MPISGARSAGAKKVIYRRSISLMTLGGRRHLRRRARVEAIRDSVSGLRAAGSLGLPDLGSRIPVTGA